MIARWLRIVPVLACIAALSSAQQPSSDVPTLEEIVVSGPADRQRGRMSIKVGEANEVRVSLNETVGVQLILVKDQTQLLFRRKSAARQLQQPDGGSSGSRRQWRLELLPDRLLASRAPWIRDTTYVIAPNVDEADGLPAHIPFGPDVALLNLEHAGLGKNERLARIALKYALHPQTRKCEPIFWFVDYSPEGTSPYFLIGRSMQSCNRAVSLREGDLLFAGNVPQELREAVEDIFDPIASRVSNRLGSEPGNMFVAWWEQSPRGGFRLEQGGNRNSLLLLNGTGWQQGLDSRMAEELRVAIMREQLQRRIREVDWPGPFTRSAVDYLLLLTRSDEDQTTQRQLGSELPKWLAACANTIRRRGPSRNREEDVPSVECGLVLQFVYDAVARSQSAGEEDVFGTWRQLLTASYRRGKSGTTPAEFLASSAEAGSIARGIVTGRMNWQKFAAALDGFGVKVNAVSGGASPVFEVQSLEHFRD